MDNELGKKVFSSFWNWSRTFYGNSFPYSFEQFLNLYGKKANTYMEGVGLAVRSTDLSQSQIDSSMRSLAMASKGKIPKDWNDYINFMNDEATSVNWIDATKFVATESAKDILKGAEAVGNSIITTGKILNFLLPAIALIFVWFWLNKKTEGQFSKAIRGFRK